MDLCSLCNRQFCTDGVLDSLSLVVNHALKSTQVDKILNVFLADDGKLAVPLKHGLKRT
jgi:hypothetical protein